MGVVYQNTDHVMLATEYCQLCEKFVVPEDTDVIAQYMMKVGKMAQSALKSDVQVRWHTPHTSLSTFPHTHFYWYMGNGPVLVGWLLTLLCTA